MTNQTEPLTVTRRLTMIELLILLIVLALAAGMLLPVITRSRRRPHPRYNCSGQLKQIGVALLMYSGDYSGLFPTTSVGNSFEPMNTADYLKDSKVYWCPSSSAIKTTAADSSYWYVGGGLRDDNSTASETRLVFDHFGNHGGKDNEWMNILFVDGHVEGGRPGKDLPFKNDVVPIESELEVEK